MRKSRAPAPAPASVRPPSAEASGDEIPELEFPQQLLDAKREQHEKIELEVRFSHRDYLPNARILHSVKAEVERKFELDEPPPVRSTVRHYPDDVRSVQDAPNAAPRYELKREYRAGAAGVGAVRTFESKAYPYKIALSEERPATDVELEALRRKTRARSVADLVNHWQRKTERTRWSYALGEGVRLDCTYATIAEGNKERQEYRIELEIEPDEATGELVSRDRLISYYLDPILRCVLESPILVTLETLARIRHSPPFSYRTPDGQSAGVRADKPEDLLVHELTAGGLLGTTRYATTIKTDGVRKLFLISGDSVYFVGVHGGSGGWSFSRVYRAPGEQLPMQGTLVDGELLESYGEGRSFYDEAAHYEYWAFDVLAYRALRERPRRHRTVRVEGEAEEAPVAPAEYDDVLVISADERTPFMRPDNDAEGAPTRLGVLQQLCTSISGPRFALHAKHFVRCDGPDRFFDACRDTLDAEHLAGRRYPFATDGLIFTPMDLPYLATFRTRDDATGRELDRSFSRKWKPVRRLTIDLLFSDGKLFVADFGKRVPFTGSRRFPWDGKFARAYPDGRALQEGQVAEFAYLTPGEPLHAAEEAVEQRRRRPGEPVEESAAAAAAQQPRLFRPVRPRRDKELPSNIKAAADVWALLHDPVHPETVRGESYQLMRRAHNRTKRELLSEIPENARDLDVGSGQGGDLLSWLDGHLRVVGLEVSAEQRKRFEQRLSDAVKQRRKQGLFYREGTITLKDFGGQSAQVQPLGRFDAATLFFVITFFRGEDLDALLTNLAAVVVPGGRLFLTGFDARRYASLLAEAAKPSYAEALQHADGHVERLKLSYKSASTTFELDGDDVRLRLAGTLVGTTEASGVQKEFAIDYDNLALELEARGFHVEEDAFLTEEPFLSEDELRYTRACRLLKLTRSAVISSIAPLGESDLELPEPPPVNVFRVQQPMEQAEEEAEQEYEIEEGLLPLLDDIEPDEVRSFEYLGYDLARIGAIGDGNCFLHAACRDMSDKYLEMDNSARVRFVRELRRETAADLTEEEFEKLGKDELHGIPQIPLVWTFKRYKAFLMSNKWLGDEFIDLFERTFDIEIIMLWFVNDRMIPSIAKSRARPYTRSIIMLNLGNQHYEAVGLDYKDKLWTVFASKHPLIVTLRNRSSQLPTIAAISASPPKSRRAGAASSSPSSSGSEQEPEQEEREEG